MKLSITEYIIKYKKDFLAKWPFVTGILMIIFLIFTAISYNYSKKLGDQSNPSVLIENSFKSSPKYHPSETPMKSIGEKNKSIKQEKSSSNIRFGVVVDDYTNQTGGLSSVQQQLPGKTIGHVSIFKHFGLSHNRIFVPEQLAYAKSQNMKVVVAWEPWNPDQGLNQSVDYLKEIPQGKHDDYIRSFALAVKDYNAPVIIRFAHEMNGNWYPWGNRPEEYKAAYLHIVNIFRVEEVNNVSWMWNVNAENVPLAPIDDVSNFYPGDEAVDFIGIDGYNFGDSRGYGWKSFEEIFTPSYNYIVSKYNKPLWIAEVGSSEDKDNGSNKALWVESMLKTILPFKFTKVVEITWFNLNKETDWRIDSSPSSLSAFQDNLTK